MKGLVTRKDVSSAAGKGLAAGEPAKVCCAAVELEGVLERENEVAWRTFFEEVLGHKVMKVVALAIESDLAVAGPRIL
jgi:hypothetical protein